MVAMVRSVAEAKEEAMVPRKSLALSPAISGDSSGDLFFLSRSLFFFRRRDLPPPASQSTGQPSSFDATYLRRTASSSFVVSLSRVFFRPGPSPQLLPPSSRPSSDALLYVLFGLNFRSPNPIFFSNGLINRSIRSRH
ncbi:hypothetical protein LXL04_026006 [Taraxacum kok-saghyz]